MAPGSQTFEDDLARMIREDIISREEGLAYADSPTNLIWRLDNTAKGKDILPPAPVEARLRSTRLSATSVFSWHLCTTLISLIYLSD